MSRVERLEEKMGRVTRALEEALSVKTDAFYSVPAWLQNERLSKIALARDVDEELDHTVEKRLDNLGRKFDSLLSHLKLEWVEGGRLEEIK